MDSITTLIQRQKKISYPDPCESTLLTLPISASTIAILSEPEVATVIEPVAADADIALGHGISAAPVVPTVDTSLEAETTGAQGVVPIGESDGERRCDKLSSNVALQQLRLHRGETVITSIVAGGVSPIYTTGAIEVQIEFANVVGQESNMGEISVLSYMIEWLTNSDETALSTISSSVRVDAASIKDGDEVDLVPDNSGCFWLSACGHCVKIRHVRS